MSYSIKRGFPSGTRERRREVTGAALAKQALVPFGEHPTLGQLTGYNIKPADTQVNASTAALGI